MLLAIKPVLYSHDNTSYRDCQKKVNPVGERDAFLADVWGRVYKIHYHKIIKIGYHHRHHSLMHETHAHRQELQVEQHFYIEAFQYED